MAFLTSNYIFTLGAINQEPNLTSLYHITRHVMADSRKHVLFQRWRTKHSVDTASNKDV